MRTVMSRTSPIGFALCVHAVLRPQGDRCILRRYSSGPPELSPGTGLGRQLGSPHTEKTRCRSSLTSFWAPLTQVSKDFPEIGLIRQSRRHRVLIFRGRCAACRALMKMPRRPIGLKEGPAATWDHTAGEPQNASVARLQGAEEESVQ